MLVNLLSNVSFYLPEIIVIVTMCFLLILECFYSENEGKRHMSYIFAMIGLVLAALAILFNGDVKAVSLFADAVVIDSFGNMIKLIMIIGTAGCFYISAVSKDIYQELKAEFLIMALGVLIGGMLLVSANNLLTLYLGIETLSILSYVMTAMKRRDGNSTEAGIKYALYGGVTAGVMLYGMSHIYGIFGSIQFVEILSGLKVLESTQVVGAAIAFLLFFVGIGYKVACFPFHMWSPDVYEGSPVPVTAFFSIVPKLAGIAIITRVTTLFFSEPNALSEIWLGLMQFIAAMTMTVGNISALNQTSVKRMLAFSSIGHVGMILMGVLVMDPQGYGAILFYGLVYMFMTLGAFYITSIVVNKYGSDERIYFRGLFSNNMILGTCLCIILFSLAGIPPLGGFASKFNIISVAVSKGYIGLAIIAAMNSAIALFYYLKLVRVMVLEESDGKVNFESFSLSGAVYIIAITFPIIFLGIFWNKVMSVYTHVNIAIGTI